MDAALPEVEVLRPRSGLATGCWDRHNNFGARVLLLRLAGLLGRRGVAAASCGRLGLPGLQRLTLAPPRRPRCRWGCCRRGQLQAHLRLPWTWLSLARIWRRRGASGSRTGPGGARGVVAADAVALWCGQLGWARPGSWDRSAPARGPAPRRLLPSRPWSASPTRRMMMEKTKGRSGGLALAAGCLLRPRRRAMPWGHRAGGRERQQRRRAPASRGAQQLGVPAATAA